MADQVDQTKARLALLSVQGAELDAQLLELEAEIVFLMGHKEDIEETTRSPSGKKCRWGVLPYISHIARTTAQVAETQCEPTGPGLDLDWLDLAIGDLDQPIEMNDPQAKEKGHQADHQAGKERVREEQENSGSQLVPSSAPTAAPGTSAAPTAFSSASPTGTPATSPKEAPSAATGEDVGCGCAVSDTCTAGNTVSVADGELDDKLRMVRGEMERVTEEAKNVRAAMKCAESELDVLINAPVSDGCDPTESLPDELMLMVLMRVPFRGTVARGVRCRVPALGAVGQERSHPATQARWSVGGVRRRSH